MSARLFVAWQRFVVAPSEGVVRSRASAVGFLATERYLGTKTSTTTTGHTSDKSGGRAPYSSEDRLVQLRKAEKLVAVFAGVSLLVGYVALKTSFSGMSKNKTDVSTLNGEKKGLHPRPLVVAGPSGAGKSTLLKKAFREYPDKFGFSVSHTTRKPRPGEVDGREYHFLSQSCMEQSIKRGDFIEHAHFSGNVYGTSKAAVAAVREKGMICVLDIDMQGVRSIKTTDLNPVCVLIKPPSLAALEERLRGRGTETEDSIQKRLNTAKEELEFAATPGVFDHVIENNELELAFSDLCKFLQEMYGEALK